MSSTLVSRTSGKSEKVVFRIEKDFSVANIEQIKQELDDIVASEKAFHLELKNIDSIDLSAIQVLHALKMKMGKAFTYSATMKDETKTILAHSGFEDFFKK